MPLQIIQIDNTSLDVFTVDTESREIIGTPYLTASIDVYSGMITGIYLSLNAPSRYGISTGCGWNVIT